MIITSSSRAAKQINRRMAWQMKPILTTDSRYKDGTNKIRFQMRFKLKPREVEKDEIQKNLLSYKKIVATRLLLDTKILGLNFYRIKGEKVLFKKRKNINLNTVFVGYFNSNYIYEILVMLGFWVNFTNYMRKNLRLHTGYNKRLNLRAKTLSLVFVNPLLANLYFENNKFDLSKYLQKNMLINFSLENFSKPYLKELYKFL